MTVDEFNDMEQAAIEDGALTEDQVRHSHWWSDEVGYCKDKIHPMLELVRDDPEMRLCQHGTSVDSDGVHKVSMTFEVQGEPWGGSSEE